MERLTKRENGHVHYPQCFEAPCCGMGCKIEDCPVKVEICERLAAYEDTGLTPGEVHSMQGEWCAMMSVLNSIGGGYDRLRELAEADKDGRVVVLPCKVGQRVFALLHGERRVTECEVKQVVSGDLDWVTLEPCGKSGTEYGVALNGFGKTVFLTREDAEAALGVKRDG